MKKISIAILIIFACFSFTSSEIPSSKLSREVIKKTKPILIKEFKKSGFKLGDPIYLRIFKEESELEVWVKKGNRFELFKTYPICDWGIGDLGPKLKLGDMQAPEGFYFVRPNQLNPYSNYHLSINVGYPNKYDRAFNRTGGYIMIHGYCVSAGCFAMKNKRIEEIYTIVDSAFRREQEFFRIHIFPFRMTDENIKEHYISEWKDFWLNLKKGYDLFEDYGNIPPNVEVKNKKYLFNKPD